MKKIMLDKKPDKGVDSEPCWVRSGSVSENQSSEKMRWSVAESYNLKENLEGWEEKVDGVDCCIMHSYENGCKC